MSEDTKDFWSILGMYAAFSATAGIVISLVVWFLWTVLPQGC